VLEILRNCRRWNYRAFNIVANVDARSATCLLSFSSGSTSLWREYENDLAKFATQKRLSFAFIRTRCCH
jgi:hypothetical protein